MRYINYRPTGIYGHLHIIDHTQSCSIGLSLHTLSLLALSLLTDNVLYIDTWQQINGKKIQPPLLNMSNLFICKHLIMKPPTCHTTPTHYFIQLSHHPFCGGSAFLDFMPHFTPPKHTCVFQSSKSSSVCNVRKLIYPNNKIPTHQENCGYPKTMPLKNKDDPSVFSFCSMTRIYAFQFFYSKTKVQKIWGNFQLKL